MVSIQKFDDGITVIFEKINGNTVIQNLVRPPPVLLHADDATLLAHTRERAVSKLCDLLRYCNMNSNIPQYTKCKFMVINGNEMDTKPIVINI